MIDVSILRRSPEDRVRTVSMFNDEAKIRVLFCGRQEMQRISAVAAELIKAGMSSDDAHNAAWGRVALIDWNGFVDGDQPLTVSDENRDVLMLGSVEVRREVIAAASSLKVDTVKN